MGFITWYAKIETALYEYPLSPTAGRCQTLVACHLGEQAEYDILNLAQLSPAPDRLDILFDTKLFGLHTVSTPLRYIRV